MLLGEYVGRRPDSIRLECSERRVRVPGFSIACDLSAVSGAVLLGFSGSGQIGVSIERVRADIPYPQRNLTPPAMARVRAQPPQARNELAAREWSRQEALRRLGGAGVLLGIPELPGFAPAAATAKPRALRTFQLCF
jgi:phosphopantetheinyl transferase